MEAVQVGRRDGIEAAAARLNGDTFHAPLTWNAVRRELLDFQPDAILDAPYPAGAGELEDENEPDFMPAA